MHERRKTERRKTNRSRVLKGAKLVLEKSMMIDCVVRNLTNIGARIHIPNTVELPKAFGLTFDGGYSIHCVADSSRNGRRISPKSWSRVRRCLLSDTGNWRQNSTPRLPMKKARSSRLNWNTWFDAMRC
jgi:hypothetical protein